MTRARPRPSTACPRSATSSRYRALQAALDAALARRRHRGALRRARRPRRRHAGVRVDRRSRDGAADLLTARLAAVADGAARRSPASTRERRDYGQVALVAKVVARSRRIDGRRVRALHARGPDGAAARRAITTALVWTHDARARSALLALADDEFLARARSAISARASGGFARVARPARRFRSRCECRARTTAARASSLLGNAAQALHPVAGQGFNLGLRDACELAQRLLDTPRDATRRRAMLARYARARRVDRVAGIAFTHGLVRAVRQRPSAARAGRAALALTLLDAVPPAKRAFTRAMMFGMR